MKRCRISKATRKMQDGKNFHLRFPFVREEEEDIGKKKEGKDGRKTTFPVNLSGHQYTLTRDLVSVV